MHSSESLNLADVLKLPVIFVLEDNQYAYSTPANYQYAIPDLIARAEAFGLPEVTVPGNNILDVPNAVADAISHARNGDYCVFSYQPRCASVLYLRLQTLARHQEQESEVVS